MWAGSDIIWVDRPILEWRILALGCFGQILISGAFNHRIQRNYQTHALADILGRCALVELPSTQMFCDGAAGQ